MILMAELQIPTRVIQQQLASAITMVVQVTRLQDGSRKIINISEVVGQEEHEARPRRGGAAGLPNRGGRTRRGCPRRGRS
jgi:Flp pilus assembly CpaF family ATPase